MPVWRPPRKICPKVLGIVVRNGSLLAMEVTNDHEQVEGVRPPGGSIEFGETRELALVREFQEEFDTGITIAGPWVTLENIYEHYGQIGHEYVFIARVELLNEDLYQRSRFRIPNEGAAGWFPISSLMRRELVLYPEGLIDWLQSESQ